MAKTTLGEMMDPKFRPAINNTGADFGPYLCVKRVPAEAPDGVVLTTAATERACGVLAKTLFSNVSQVGSNSGEMVVTGRCRMVASAAIAADDPIAPAANGKTQTAVATNVVIGRALEAAAADGDIYMAEVDFIAPVVL